MEAELDPTQHIYWRERVKECVKLGCEDNEPGLVPEDFLEGLCIQAYLEGKASK